jgi:hypothetical protein
VERSPGRKRLANPRDRGSRRSPRESKDADCLLPSKSQHAASHPLVLFDLVWRYTRPVFRSESAPLADIAWPWRNHRVCALDEHHRRDSGRDSRRPLGRPSAFSHAVLRLEFCRPGQGTQFPSHRLAASGRELCRAWPVRGTRNAGESDAATPVKLVIIAGLDTMPGNRQPCGETRIVFPRVRARHDDRVVTRAERVRPARR